MEIKFTIKQVVAVGIGAALFVVIGMINIPTPVPNTSIQLQYAVQALLSIIFGPIIGLLVGLIGHAIKDSLVGYGLWWTWIIASGLFGLVVGLFRKYVRVINSVFDWKDILIFNLIQLLANALVWGVLAPLGDVVIYQEAAEKVFAQGIVAGIANGVSVAIAGTLLLLAYAGTQTRAGSLKKVWYSMKIKEQTRKLAAGCSKQCFEVMIELARDAQNTVLRLWIELARDAQNTVLRLRIELTKSVTIPMIELTKSVTIPTARQR
ncbi:protein YdcD [Streptococcus pneumoniae]|nr:protein YdcD [Streptococcus pneumoniae]